MRLRMAVIGVGHLGQAHARILSGLPGVELVGVADVNGEQAQIVADKCGTRAFTHYGALLDQVDAATIVVPTTQHHVVGKAFLEHGVHLLVEKPIATTVEQADDLIRSAKRGGAVLQVGHIERFNPAFESLMDRPIRPVFVECERHGPFTGRSTDIGAVLDLMIHDLDLLHALDPSPVVSVEAMGVAIFGGHEDLVNARFRFESGCMATVTASRISPLPKRRLRIWAPEGYAGLDFVQRRLALVQPSDDLRRNGLNVQGLDAARRAQVAAEVFGTHMEMNEQICTAPQDQLTSELSHFVECVRQQKTPRVTGEDGRDALALAIRVLDSLRNHAWDGASATHCGPGNMPMPRGKLFASPQQSRAAA